MFIKLRSKHLRYIVDKAPSKSAIISLWLSNPIDKRIIESLTPEFSFCSLFSCLCVVDAGCTINDLVSPTFARWDIKLQFSTNCIAPSYPLFTENVKTDPNPF